MRASHWVDRYFRSWWMPSTICLALFIGPAAAFLVASTDSLTLVSGLFILITISLFGGLSGPALLGVLFASYFQFFKLHAYYRGLVNALGFVVCLVLTYFGWVVVNGIT